MNQISPTVQDDVYNRLRSWLMIGRFAPGARLKIRHMAAELGVGIMPVRAALQRLAAEGALTNTPNAGVAVPRISAMEFDDLLQMRLLLEGEAAERGAYRLQLSEVAALQNLSNQMRTALSVKDPHAYLDANEAFHLVLYRAAGSPILLGLIEGLWLKAGPLSTLLFESDDGYDFLNDGHEEAIRHLETRNHHALRREIERDIYTAAKLVRSNLYPNVPPT